MKLSLCLIVGNVEDYIERCLDSFKHIADEIVVVRAIGHQHPDRTLHIAREKYGAICGEYLNQKEHRDWPHVDNFAAARQLSFDMASNDLCFWCDSDDILKAGAERIRELAAAGSYACYLFPYDVFGKNVVVHRERMMLRTAGQWRQPVHEFFEFRIKDTPSALDDSVVIQHLPKLSKTGSNDRNLRILQSIPEEDRTPGLKYHLFNELYGAQKTDEAVALGTELIANETLAKDERYDVLVSLVCHTDNLDSRVALLHEAHKCDPTRREALGVLSCTMMDMGLPASAMAYARQMAATLEPQNHAWNSRRPFYGYIGDEIYAQALRVNGRFADAEVVRRDSLKRHGGPKISILHATRARPQLAAKTRKAWHDLAAEPGRIEHIFAIDDDDQASQVLRRFHHVMVPAGGGCVRAWNIAAATSNADILVQLSDDWLPVPQWDNLIAERIGDPTQTRVLAISDGVRTDDLLCMAICTRAYWCLDYFLFHPWFTGVYSDNWFTELAYARKAVIDAKDIVFQHRHPIVTGEPMDATYLAQNSVARYAEGKELIEYLRTGADWSSVPGFFNYHDFYGAIAGLIQDGETVVEVGVWLGRSSIFLAQTLQRLGKHNVKLLAVDTFLGESNQVEHEATVRLAGGNLRASFETNLKRCGVENMVTILEGDSACMASQVADASVTFCFIDAAHDYDSVKRDLLAWQPKIRTGGRLAGHDFQHPPVRRAVEDVIGSVKIIGNVWLQ